MPNLNSNANVTLEAPPVTMPTLTTIPNSTPLLSTPQSIKRKRATVSDEEYSEDVSAFQYRRCIRSRCSRLLSQTALYACKAQEDDERPCKKHRSARIDANTEASISDPPPHHSTCRMRDAADMFLATELRRRKDKGFAPLSDSEKVAFLNNARQMIEKIGTGASFDNIKDNTKTLHMLTQNAKTKADHDLYTAALFAAHYGRIRTELDALDASMQSRISISPENLNALKGSIDRLYQCLHQDKMWRHITAHLKFRTDTLRTIRDEVRSAETLQHRTILIAKINCIERLLMPEENDDYDATLHTDPLADALQQNQEMQKTIANTEAHHKQELIRRDRELLNMNLRLKHASLNSKAKDQDASVTEHLIADINHEKKARLDVEKRLKNEIVTINTKHKRQVTDLAIIYEKKFKQAWRAREEENRKIEDDAVKLSNKDKSLLETKLARRNELLVKAKKRNMGIQHLLNRQQDGTLALTKETEIPSKQQCLDGLTNLWGSKGALISQVLPHELMNDRDFALEFEVEITVTARVFMLALQLWGFKTEELLGTHWSPTAICRLKYGLVPYHSDTPLTTLSVAICNIHEILQQAVMNMNAGSMLATNCSQPVAWIAGANDDAKSCDQSVQPPSVQQPPSIAVTQPTPPAPSVIMDTWQDENSPVPMEHGSTNAYQGYVPDTVYQSHEASSFGFAPPVQQGREKRRGICHNLAKRGLCSFGDRCKFSHNIDSLQDAHRPELQAQSITTAPQDISMIDQQCIAMRKSVCYSMAKKGFCSFGDRCRFSHDIVSVQATPHTESASQDINMTDGRPGPRVDKRAAMPCNNIEKFGSCRRPSCPYLHPTGTHIGAAPPVPGNVFQARKAPIFTDALPNAPLGKACFLEAVSGQCKSLSCAHAHKHPHGPTNEMTMADAGLETYQGSQVGGPKLKSAKPCYYERDNGQCTRTNCKFTHIHTGKAGRTGGNAGYNQRGVNPSARNNDSAAGLRSSMTLDQLIRANEPPRGTKKMKGVGNGKRNHMKQQQWKNV
jgi:hypothetical protein